MKVRSDLPGLHKGFSLTSKTVDAVARISLDVSDSVPDGLYVVFAYVSTGSVRDVPSFERVLDAALTAYRSLQSSAQIELVEPA